MNSGLILPAFVETGLVTYRDVTQGGIKVRQGDQSTAPLHAPLPSLYTSVVIVYGSLALLPSSLTPIPQLIGWGFVLATFLNLYTPGSANAAKAANVKAANALSSPPGGVTSKPTTVRSA